MILKRIGFVFIGTVFFLSRFSQASVLTPKDFESKKKLLVEKFLKDLNIDSVNLPPNTTIKVWYLGSRDANHSLWNIGLVKTKPTGEIIKPYEFQTDLYDYTLGYFDIVFMNGKRKYPKDLFEQGELLKLKFEKIRNDSYSYIVDKKSGEDFEYFLQLRNKFLFSKNEIEYLVPLLQDFSIELLNMFEKADKKIKGNFIFLLTFFVSYIPDDLLPTVMKDIDNFILEDAKNPQKKHAKSFAVVFFEKLAMTKILSDNAYWYGLSDSERKEKTKFYRLVLSYLKKYVHSPQLPLSLQSKAEASLIEIQKSLLQLNAACSDLLDLNPSPLKN